MKKLVQNTISILLLVFYLTGFCGLNFLKHKCFSCEQESFHIIYNQDKCGSEINANESDSLISHHYGIFSQTEYKLVSCCVLKFIYLKHSPKTRINQEVKSPLLPSLDLFLSVDQLKKNLFADIPTETSDYLKKIITPPDKTQEILCCYRC